MTDTTKVRLIAVLRRMVEEVRPGNLVQWGRDDWYPANMRGVYRSHVPALVTAGYFTVESPTGYNGPANRGSRDIAVTIRRTDKQLRHRGVARNSKWPWTIDQHWSWVQRDSPLTKHLEYACRMTKSNDPAHSPVTTFMPPPQWTRAQLQTYRQRLEAIFVRPRRSLRWAMLPYDVTYRGGLRFMLARLGVWPEFVGERFVRFAKLDGEVAKQCALQCLTGNPAVTLRELAEEGP